MCSSRRLLSVLIVVFLGCAASARAEQTIVFFRHGEKPAGGYGQLTCQGFNRALALPTVLLSKFGPAQYVYAPNPAVKVPDPVGLVHYIRPLATIEPIAVKLGLGVNTQYGYNDVAGLQSILIKSSKANSTIFVAWEHQYLVKVVQSIMNSYGGGAPVPAWTSGDYDALYIVTLDYSTGTPRAEFRRDVEGLNGQSTVCPF
jgi:hypothetical protein